MPEKMKIGIIGAGNISKQYLTTCPKFEILEVAAIADLNMDAARAKAEEFGVPEAIEVDEMLARKDIEQIINITIPAAHVPVNLKILEAGKHAHTEKPFGMNVTEGQQVIDLAEKSGLRVGCAPDTFMGIGIQTARRVIDEGMIGKPTAAVANMISRGPEHWHPNPEFFYQRGGGALFDMGPYYLTALVSLLGPVASMTAKTKATFSEREILSEAKRGQMMPVEINTHATGILEFANGVLATTIFSFDVFGGHNMPMLEIHGTEGSLIVPDPNTFGGEVKVKLRDKDWEVIEPTHTHTCGRGLGPADIAYSVRSGRPHRASGDLAFHVLEIMETYDISSNSAMAAKLKTTCALPAPIPAGLPEGVLDT